MSAQRVAKLSSMDAALQKLVQASGLTLPLAAQIVDLILASGASRHETMNALTVVRMTLDQLPISLDPDPESLSPDPS
jgi:hypothetical protein